MGSNSSKANNSIRPRFQELLQPLLNCKQRKLVRKYLPHFQIFTKALRSDVKATAMFWNEEFVSERPGLSSGSNPSYSRQSPCFGACPSSPASQLYDAFFNILTTEAPQLMPAFHLSMQARSKIIHHICIGIQTVLDSGEDFEKVTKITQTHLQFGVKLEHYDALGCVFLKALEVVAGDAWNVIIEAAWKRIFTHCAVIIMSHHAQAVKESGIQRRAKRLTIRRNDLVVPLSSSINQNE